MKGALLLILLPYCINILDRLSSVILDKGTLRKSFRDVMRLPSSGVPSGLNPLAQSAVLKHLSYSMLKQSVVIVALLYSFAAVVVLYEHREYAFGLEWLLFLMLFGIVMVWWVLGNDVAYFSKESWLHLSRGDWAQLLFCGYELILAVLSVSVYLTAPHEAPGVKGQN